MPALPGSCCPSLRLRFVCLPSESEVTHAKGFAKEMTDGVEMLAKARGCDENLELDEGCKLGRGRCGRERRGRSGMRSIGVWEGGTRARGSSGRREHEQSRSGRPVRETESATAGWSRSSVIFSSNGAPSHHLDFYAQTSHLTTPAHESFCLDLGSYARFELG